MFEAFTLLLPLGPKLAELTKAGMKFYADAHANGRTVDSDKVAGLIEALSGSWNPEVKGIRVLDDPGTRKAGARFLAGIAVALEQAKAVV